MRKAILISSRSKVSTHEETEGEKWGVRDGKCSRSDSYVHKRTITVQFFVSHSGRHLCEERCMMLSMKLIDPATIRPVRQYLVGVVQAKFNWPREVLHKPVRKSAIPEPARSGDHVRITYHPCRSSVNIPLRSLYQVYSASAIYGTNPLGRGNAHLSARSPHRAMSLW